MVGDDRTRPPELEGGNLGKDLALVGNGGSEHVVEGRDAIGGHDEQLIAEIVNVPDFSGLVGRAIGKRGGEDGRGKWQAFSSNGKFRILQAAADIHNNNM